jgi:hypothetical protein
MSSCTVCGESSGETASQTSGMCRACWDANFSGAEPPLGWAEVEAAALALTRIVARQRQEEA